MAKFYIDAAMLERRGACYTQVALFRRTFGDAEVPVTVENISKARRAGLHVEWPVTEPWWTAVCGSALERKACPLRDAAFAADDKALLDLYHRAAKLWPKIKEGRA